MTKEWESPWNPFNSMKILMWKEHLEACAKGEYLTPKMVDVDLSLKCPAKCYFCNASQMINNEKDDLPTEHFLKLADFLKEWKISSCCISGGGESLMHKGFNEIIKRFYDNDIQVGLITNLIPMKEENIEYLAKYCRWIGISVDSANKETYLKIKGINAFDLVCNNIKKLTAKVKELKVNNGICFKFLLGPDNYTEIYDAVVLAKSLGVEDFHLRPVGYLGIPQLKDTKLEYTQEMLDIIDSQMEKAMKLGTKDFHVYGIRHKFNPNLQPKKNFSKCWAIPMLPTFTADGDVMYCFDIRSRKDTVMCRHYPDVTEIARFWNSQKHKDMVNNFDINSCVRCFPGNTNIIIKEGIKFIDKINKSDIIISALNNKRKINNIFIRKSDEELLKITYKGNNNPILITKNHKIPVLTIKNCHYAGKKTKCFGKPCGIMNSINTRSKNANCRVNEINETLTIKESKDINVNDFLIFPKFKQHKINKFSTLPNDVLWILGLFLAEGTCDKENKRGYGIHFYLGEKEIDIATKLEKILLKYFNLEPNKRYIRNSSMTLYYSSKELQSLCRIFNHLSYNKTIPTDFIIGLNSNQLFSFLIGYLDGDGCIKKYNSTNIVSAVTVSKNLAYQIQQLCSKLDLFCAIREQPRRISYIKGRKIEYKHTPYEIKILNNNQRSKLFNIKSKTNKNYFFENEKFFAVPILKIEKIKYSGNLYNIEVKKDHNYLVQGIAVENCTFSQYHEAVEQVFLQDKMYRKFL